MKSLILQSTFLCGLSLATFHAQAMDHHGDVTGCGCSMAVHKNHVRNVPASIMGDHVHAKGKFMMSYNFVHMHMEGSRDGRRDLSTLDISGDYANNTGSGASTLRVVPTEMDMDMHMMSAMYGVTGRLTMMVMGSYQEKSMDMVTYAMMNSDQELGRFTGRSQGFGDVKMAALYDLAPSNPYNVIGKIGVSLPVGSIDEETTMLTPMNTYQSMRMAYGMQLGSGTYDIEPALTVTRQIGDYSYGGQYKAIVHTGRNSEGYSLGDKHVLSLFGGYQFNRWIGGTARLSAEHESQIDGADDQIFGPNQAADPHNYGGQRAELGLGAEIQMPQRYGRASVEASLPLYQDLNGPQLKRDYGFTARYRFSF